MRDWFALIALLLTAPAVSSSAEAPLSASRAPLPVRLCEALQVVKAGERIPVRVSGIYVTGLELQLLYDPQQPRCSLNIQPSTWVEFAPSAVQDTRLVRLVERSGRASVTLVGDLYGPGALGPDDLSLSANVAFANRVAGHRYGHLNAFRTKLVVDKVLLAEPVPDSQPWNAVWAQPPEEERLVVRAARLPVYPPLARRGGITGAVVAEVEVKAGTVTRVEIKSGDRLLASETVANIRTWQFDADTNGSFSTAFVYHLEKRKVGDEGPTVELHLPASVRITAASFDW